MTPEQIKKDVLDKLMTIAKAKKNALTYGDIAEVLEMVLGTDDIIVVIEGEHSCMTARGVKKPGTKTRTATLRGVFKTDSDLRTEFYNLIKQ